MKVHTLSRSEYQFTRERSQDLQRTFHNRDPILHHQYQAVEYQRAVSAAKLGHVFAKPFLGSLEGHRDSVSCMTKNPNHLKGIFSGSMDGDIMLWDISSRQIVRQFPGHQGAVRGLTASTDGRILVSCGTDCTVRLWNVPVVGITESYESSDYISEPLAVYVWKNAFSAVDHQWDGGLFATAGAQVDIWDHNRSEPVSSFDWGSDTSISVRFNPGEPNMLATSSRDRSITIYDLRLSTPVRKLIMKTKTNSIAWNPMEPMNFTAANEDCNCYSYDARKLDVAKCVHEDHVSAVMDIDYSPTGREFVTGSYDRTVRIFNYNGGHSREIYHTKRMQRVFCVKFSCDGSYIISGSDDTNLRLWKANASEQMGVMHLLFGFYSDIFPKKRKLPHRFISLCGLLDGTNIWLLPRERKKHEYNQALVKRFKHLPEVKRIVRHRHLPKPIFKASALRRTMVEAQRRKDKNIRAHHAPGSIPTVSMRKKRIIKEE